MASIKKRPNGTYQATIYVGRDAKGKQLFEYVTRDSSKECKSAARAIEDEIERGTYVNVKNIKVCSWIADWIELNKDRLSPSTVHIYKLYLSAHYEPYFGDMKLDKVKSNEILIKKFMAEKLETLSPNTVRKLVSVLNKVFHDALKSHNPVQYIDMPKKVKYKPHVVTDDEISQIWEIVKGTTDEAIILLAAWGGLRLGEICALKPNDIFVNESAIVVDESMTINDQYDYEFKAPKSDNGFRKVTIPNYLMSLLQDHIKEMMKKSRKRHPDKLFGYLPNSYSQRFHKIITDNKLPQIRFHDLRHYHASYLYNSGMPDHYAAERLGHDIQTLKTIYQHLGLKRKTELDEAIKNTLPGLNHAQQNAQQNLVIAQSNFLIK